MESKDDNKLSNYSEKGLSKLTHLVKNCEYKQANADRFLREELDNLSKQRQEVELKQLEIFEEYRFEKESYSGDKRPISILDAIYDILPDVPQRRNDMVVQNKGLEIEAEYDTPPAGADTYGEIAGKHRKFGKAGFTSGRINAPVVMGHQDKKLRYRFIYNHFPSLHEENGLGPSITVITERPTGPEIQNSLSAQKYTEQPFGPEMYRTAFRPRNAQNSISAQKYTEQPFGPKIYRNVVNLTLSPSSDRYIC
ncbi:hypothetical protein HYC85_027874 [Camellia sinensis]|uniref:Uncharacterized protein n=1 Tax=Camellia sinensis TaxID=4442 RepID=A0A7J7FTI5_CAMSI|nr:hypothetical protein HYC85_027874 [Camellia sinensis]